MSQTNYKEILEAAAARIEQPGTWTQGVLARNAKGFAVHEADPAATCWCAIGAIRAEIKARKMPDGHAYHVSNLILALPEMSSRASIASYNDGMATQQDVVALLRKAAERAPS